MATFDKVTAQLHKTIAAHRTVHHHTVREGRRERARLAAEKALFQPAPETIAEPEPIGMPAALPPQGADGLYDLAD